MALATDEEIDMVQAKWGLYGLVMENMKSIKYQGKWKDSLRAVYERAALAEAS